MCGLEIQTEGDQVTRVRGDRDDVWSKGYLCPKGAVARPPPPRPRPPARADGARRRRVARGHVGRGVRPLRGAARGRSSTSTASPRSPPTSATRRSTTTRSAATRARSPASPACRSSGRPGTVDQWPKNLACAQLFGNPWSIPIPDVARTDLFVVMGANPHASQGSLLSCPDLIGEIDRIRERGGRTIVVDPRRTGTAERADEWIPIMPGHGRRVPARDRPRARRRRPRSASARSRAGCRASRRCCAAARDFTPEAVADGVRRARRAHPPARPRARRRPSGPSCTAASGCATRSSARSPRGRSTSSTCSPATSTSRAARCSPRPAIATISQTARRRGPVKTGRWHTRVRGAPEVLGQAPLSCLAEEIATPGRGPGAGARSRSPATRCCPRPTPAGSTRRCRCSTR